MLIWGRQLKLDLATIKDKIAVLVYGEIIAFDTPDAVRSNPRVQEAYLGSMEEQGH